MIKQGKQLKTNGKLLLLCFALQNVIIPYGMRIYYPRDFKWGKIFHVTNMLSASVCQATVVSLYVNKIDDPLIINFTI